MAMSSNEDLHAHYGTGSGGGQWELAGEATDDNGNLIDISEVVPNNLPGGTISYFVLKFDFEGNQERHKLEQPMPLQKVASHTRYKSQGYTNPNWVVASMLLLPKPRSKKSNANLPVVTFPSEKGYWVETVDLGVESAPPGEIFFIPDEATIMSPSGQTMTIDTNGRLERIFTACNKATRGQNAIEDLVCDFEEMVFGSAAFNADSCQDIIDKLMKELSLVDADYIYGEDCLETLEESLGLKPAQSAQHDPIDVSKIPPESIEERKKNQRRWTKAACRGSEGRKFARDVEKAYDATCVICGSKLPRTKSTKIGVESAHILPWAKTGLNSVNNGLCLCRQHHWAFDERLLKVSFDGKDYVVDKGAFYDEFEKEVGATRASSIFGALPRTISRANLPSNPALLPNPSYLDEYNDYIK